MISRDELEDYAGKEHMVIKHQLLEAYLERLIMIIGQGRARKIAFIDGYAGPWQAAGSDLSKTSFARAHEIMVTCRNALARRGIQVAMRALFVEEKRMSYQRLKCWSIEHETDDVAAVAWKEDFRDAIPKIVNWLAPEEFAFVLIDPTGLAPTPTQLAPLLQRPNTEVLINVMWDFINRFRGHGNFVPACRDFFGDDYQQKFSLDEVGPRQESLEIGRRVMDCFAARIRDVGRGGRQAIKYRCARFPVEFVECATRVKYYLFFASASYKGLLVFLEVCEPELVAQKRIKLLIEERATGIRDLFSDEAVQLRTDSSRARTSWLQRLPKAGESIRTSEELLADLVEEAGSLISEVQEAFRELQEGGVLMIEGVKRARPKKPVHFDKLELIRRLK